MVCPLVLVSTHTVLEKQPGNTRTSMGRSTSMRLGLIGGSIGVRSSLIGCSTWEITGGLRWVLLWTITLCWTQSPEGGMKHGACIFFWVINWLPAWLPCHFLNWLPCHNLYWLPCHYLYLIGCHAISCLFWLPCHSLHSFGCHAMFCFPFVTTSILSQPQLNLWYSFLWLLCPHPLCVLSCCETLLQTQNEAKSNVVQVPDL